ncbi:hypothetical protein AMS68_003228 [Peltaster fructicola]|uniref:RNA helicase n=1 Tax=Peltaster fructicola TaxID=286661 RepID=A0A6H0XSS3_9PEZI|nr:hypothetical protein AMS68_003228 [Peltaster fructicola]
MAHDEPTKKQPKSFEALTPELSQWILDYTHSMGFARTTPVQAMAIPLLMGNKDLVVEAVTGSGKTLSFLIPIVERLLKAEDPNKKGHVRSIVVAPTKELVIQIHDVLKTLLDFHPPTAAYPQHHERKQTQLDDMLSDDEDEEPVPPGPYAIPQLLIGGRVKLQEDLATFSSINPNILIGTPKRLVEVLESSRAILKRHWFDLLVLDEADRLLDANFQADLQKILDVVPKERRTGLFSASVSAAVDELVRVGLRYPFKISAKVRSKTGALDKTTPESLRLYYLVTKPVNKIPALQQLLQDTRAQKTILYVSTRAAVDYWDKVLPAILGIAVYPMHGAHKADIRAKNLQRFRNTATTAVLLTTDVLARGIDIPDIDLVVQLDPPSQPKDFIHRCGRSGRAGKRGIAVTLLSEGSEEDYIKYLGIQGTTLEPYSLSTPVSDAASTSVIQSIRQQNMQKRELHDRAQRAFVSWVQAYTKTLPADIFSVKRVDWASIGEAWGLLCWPKMPELKRYFPEAAKDRKLHLSVPDGFSLHELQYADKSREAKRQAYLSARERGELPERTSKGGNAADLAQRKERAWSSQKEAKTLRENRRERKEVRRKAERGAKMDDAERVKEAELQSLIAKVRAQNELKMAADGFEGFGD